MTVLEMSVILLWIVVGAMAVTIVALLRQIGVLHARLAPLSVHPGGEGPPVGEPAPLVGEHGYRARLTVVLMTSPSCPVCAQLRPGFSALHHAYRDLDVVELEYSDDTAATFRAMRVSSTPYAVTVDDEGVVRGAGVANSIEQIEELIARSGVGTSW
jgi:thiol-disulfide isomerase/thioredoxin